MDEALQVLEWASTAADAWSGNVRPIAHYIAGAVHEARGDTARAAEERERARAADLTRAFPFGLDALDALEAALAADPDDAVAHSLIGMLLYAHGRRSRRARTGSRRSRSDASTPSSSATPRSPPTTSVTTTPVPGSCTSEAVAAAPDDARLRYEQDQLAIRLGQAASERLPRLRPVEALVLSRDDFTIEYLKLLLDAGEAARALEILMTRSFHPWEGGEGQAIAAWDAALAANGLPQSRPARNARRGAPRSTFPRGPPRERGDGLLRHEPPGAPAVRARDR